MGQHVEEFLTILGGPACIFLEGVDDSRTRAFVTLLHGNEPSGARALFRWLKSGQQPQVSTVCILGAVNAALSEPLFSHRMLPGDRDLNRCFQPPFDDEPGRLAEEILEILRMHHPEAVVDMHNTSGSGPAFGVCTHMDRHHDALVSKFTQRLIISNLGLGALMDISESACPTVTVEVGGRLDDEAHTLAYEGLCRYLLSESVLAADDTDWGLELLHDPIRLELREGVSLRYGNGPDTSFDITLKSDVEQYNFGTVNSDTPLGWMGASPRDLFKAQDAKGDCAVERLVRTEEGVLYAARDLKLFMITSNAVIAQSDCLFYAVADDGRPIA